MAKRKKTGKRRKVGASSALNPKSPIAKVAAVAVGYLAGDKINALMDSIIPTKTVSPATATTPAITAPVVSSKVIGAAQVGLGGLLLMKGKPSLVKTAVGGVVAGAGLKRLLVSFGVVKGYQNVPVLGSKRMGAYQSTPVLAGYGSAGSGVSGIPPQLAGIPPQLAGYGSAGSGVMGSLYTNGASSSGYME